MTLQDVINEAIANAFRAGAEWHAVHWCRQDSAAVGRDEPRWQEQWDYQRSLRRHQREAAESIGRAILRLVVEQERPRQAALFGEPEVATVGVVSD